MAGFKVEDAAFKSAKVGSSKEESTKIEHYQVIAECPAVDEFCALRKQVGWGETDVNMAALSLKNTLYCVCIRQSKILLAMGRVVGDSAMYFYIQDVIVAPAYQGQGLGHLIMLNIEEYLQASAQKGATIGLLAAQGKSAFYERYDYMQRPSKTLGPGMCRFV
ncbi:GCN5-related N-acetyltransferase [Paraglaciecola mesophila KMM 241]|uniref:GCN5-related N-acetyltransferase n=1 Tax=Paraglaciecola mesophila KMM 241 TaxID=1128912 RepID=K6ZCI9_9ALTE|nr:GCN5-related N-acetyltransferase [Paraglaciecola mesophila KMM 241]